MGETLLQKAKKVQDGRRRGKYEVTSEHIELALAWAKGEITPTQACAAMGLSKSTGNILYHFAIALREAVRMGVLVEAKKR